MELYLLLLDSISSPPFSPETMTALRRGSYRLITAMHFKFINPIAKTQIHLNARLILCSVLILADSQDFKNKIMDFVMLHSTQLTCDILKFSCEMWRAVGNIRDMGWCYKPSKSCMRTNKFYVNDNIKCTAAGMGGGKAFKNSCYFCAHNSSVSICELEQLCNETRNKREIHQMYDVTER